MATLDVRSLTCPFPESPDGLADVSFTAEERRICAILGPAGSGKTALLRAIAGLDAPTGGDVRIGGASVLDQPPHRRGIGLMFQDLGLFPHLSVRDNIAFGLRMAGWPAADRDQRVQDLLDVLGLPDLGAAGVGSLTAGEQQRVALARTLAPRPAVLLLDEPLGNVDDPTRQTLRQDLRAILGALDAGTVIAVRDLRDATAIGDDLVVLDAGRVLQSGPAGVVLGEPNSVRVAELAGYVTLAHGPIRRGRVEEAGVGAMAVPGLPDAPAARVMAHPAALLAVPADSGLGSGVAGLVLRARAAGPTWTVDLSVGGRLVEARWEWDLVAPRAGTRLAVAARPGTLRVFPSTIEESAGSAETPVSAAVPARATAPSPRPVAAPDSAPDPTPAPDIAPDAAPAAPETPTAAQRIETASMFARPAPAATADPTHETAQSAIRGTSDPDVPASALPPTPAWPSMARAGFAPVPPPSPLRQDPPLGATSRSAAGDLIAPQAGTPAPVRPSPTEPVPAPAPPRPPTAPPVPPPPAPPTVPPSPPATARPEASASGPVPPSALPTRRGVLRTALPPIRSEQRHRQMPLS